MWWLVTGEIWHKFCCKFYGELISGTVFGLTVQLLGQYKNNNKSKTEIYLISYIHITIILYHTPVHHLHHHIITHSLLHSQSRLKTFPYNKSFITLTFLDLDSNFRFFFHFSFLYVICVRLVYKKLSYRRYSGHSRSFNVNTWERISFFFTGLMFIACIICVVYMYVNEDWTLYFIHHVGKATCM